MKCTDHPEHVFILCFGTPTTIGASVRLPGDPTGVYPVTHYVGHTRARPEQQIIGLGAHSRRFVADLRPGDVTAAAMAKLEHHCPACSASLWYYAESPTYPGWTTEQAAELIVWPSVAGRRAFLRGRTAPT